MHNIRKPSKCGSWNIQEKNKTDFSVVARIENFEYRFLHGFAYAWVMRLNMGADKKSEQSVLASIVVAAAAATTYTSEVFDSISYKHQNDLLVLFSSSISGTSKNIILIAIGVTLTAHQRWLVFSFAIRDVMLAYFLSAFLYSSSSLASS